MKYREERNARVLEALTSQLGAAFQPLPQSNRQFENLTTAMSRLGADRVGRVWAEAVRRTRNRGWVGSPTAIKEATSELSTRKAAPRASTTPTIQQATTTTKPNYEAIADRLERMAAAYRELASIVKELF